MSVALWIVGGSVVYLLGATATFVVCVYFFYEQFYKYGRPGASKQLDYVALGGISALWFVTAPFWLLASAANPFGGWVKSKGDRLAEAGRRRRQVRRVPKAVARERKTL